MSKTKYEEWQNQALWRVYHQFAGPNILDTLRIRRPKKC